MSETEMKTINLTINTNIDESGAPVADPAAAPAVLETETMVEDTSAVLTNPAAPAAVVPEETAISAPTGLFQRCKEKLQKRLGNVGITPSNIMVIVRYAMEVVEITKLKGTDQKVMTIKLVRNLVVDSNLDETKKNICISMLDEGVVDNTIDLVIDATKGKLSINNNKDDILKIASGCCLAFFKKIIK